jgi:hypothetical protein
MEYQGSYELCTTSHLFLASSLIGFFIKNKVKDEHTDFIQKMMIGTLFVYITSVMYHLPKEGDNQLFRKMDICSNLLLGSYFTFRLYQMKMYQPVLFAIIVLCIYLGMKFIKERNKMMDHLIFIHIPVYLSFSYIYYLCLV